MGVAVDSTTRAGYYPGAKLLRVKLIAERRTGRLLGAQIVGEEGAAKRIDVLATALWHGTTVEDLINTDLSYAPPFSPLWDPRPDRRPQDLAAGEHRPAAQPQHTTGPG